MMTKRLLLLALTLFVTSSSFAAKKDGKAYLSGKIGGYNGALVTIVDPTGKIADDTLKMKEDGSFETAIVLAYPTELLFNIEDPKCSFKLYATPNSKGDYQIAIQEAEQNGEKVNVANFTYTGDNKDIVEFMRTHDYYDMINSKYSKKQLEGKTFVQFQDELSADIAKMKSDLSLLKDKQYKATKAADWDKKYQDDLFRYMLVEKKEDADFTDWLEKINRNDMNNYNNALSYAMRYYLLAKRSGDKDYDVNFVKSLSRMFSNKDIFYQVANEHIVNVMQKAPVNADAIYTAYKKLYANHEGDIPDYVKFSYEEAKRNLIGKVAEDFEMEDPDGKVIKLSDFRGKVVYLDVWATWCGPCLQELPHVKKIHDHFKDDAEVVIISLSIDDQKPAWEQIMKRELPAWQNFHAINGMKSDFCKEYNVVQLPRFICIDKQGKIISLDAPRASDGGIIDFIENGKKE